MVFLSKRKVVIKMTRLEFMEVLKVIDISSIQNLKVEYSDMNYALVKGRVPSLVSEIVYEKYPESSYGIRIDGSYEEVSPYEKGYINLYHIDTKEGLIAFLTELLDYYKRKKGEEETEVEKYSQYLDEINKNILMAVNPNISNHEWMYDDSRNRDTYFQTLSQSYETEIDAEIRDLINEFDRTVNPFLDMDISDEMSFSNLTVRGNTYTSNNMNRRGNCSYLEFKEKSSNNLVRFYRNAEGFTYQLGVTAGYNRFIDIRHFYSPISNAEHGKGEFICIEYWGTDNRSNLIMKYNLTDGTVDTGYPGGSYSPITDEQKLEFISQLKVAVNLASLVTISNLNEANCLNLGTRKQRV